MKRILCLLAGLGLLWIGSPAAQAGGGDNTNLVRIGVYDSRAVAYAHFCSDSYQSNLKERVAAARAAKQAGDPRSSEMAAALRSEQDGIHREVFSTAPAVEAMTALKERIPGIEKEAGATALVSKWDEVALKQYPNAEEVDMTDRLVREFIEPTEKQAKTIASIVKSKPLSLEKCDELIRTGKL